MQSIVESGEAREEGGPESVGVGWVGAGRMGGAMIERLLCAGHSVTAYNRTRAKLEPLVAAGAVAAETISGLGGLGTVFTSVSSSGDLLEVTLGTGGLLTLANPPSVLIDVSTVSAEASAVVRREAAGRGVALLAAPASGNPGAVRAGRATFAVSGPRDAYDKVAPLLGAIGARATYCGEGELARLVKLCHNMFLGSVIQSLVEVTLLADKGGVDRERFLSFLNSSVLGSGSSGTSPDPLHPYPPEASPPRETGLPNPGTCCDKASPSAPALPRRSKWLAHR